MTARYAIIAALFTLPAACADSPSEDAADVACGLTDGEQGGFVEIAAGSFEKGRDALYPEEGAPTRLAVDGFAIQIHEVTNDQFAAFVEATGHVTDAERGGSALFDGDGWRLAEDATWRTPEGAGSTIAGRGGHPVVHVSHADAQAYAEWAGGRLPSEVEWEYAAAQGLRDSDNPFSGAIDDAGQPIANVWQGIFPYQNTGTDGFLATAAAGCFPRSEAGLYDMIGNVWEWTDTPFGPGRHTIKGGSHLCAENYCRRYRPASRQPQESDFSASHIGFRIVRDPE
jgi:formylglycine-generating enzyme required for sulfatase activity